MQNMKSTAPFAPGNMASMQAADEIRQRLEGIRADVFQYIVSCGTIGATGSEIAEALDILPYTAKPRCTELRDAGYTVDSGLLRRNKNNRNETVWCAAPDWRSQPPYKKKADQKPGRGGWLDISTARIGQRGMFWHRSWRNPYPGIVNGDNGAVMLDFTTDGWQSHASHWQPIILPEDGK